MKRQWIMPTLSDPEVKSYLKDMHRRFVIVPIDKAANNFAFIFKNIYVSRILAELNGGSNTYKLSFIGQEELISNNIKLCKKSCLKCSRKSKGITIYVLVTINA